MGFAALALEFLAGRVLRCLAHVASSRERRRASAGAAQRGGTARVDDGVQGHAEGEPVRIQVQ